MGCAIVASYMATLFAATGSGLHSLPTDNGPEFAGREVNALHLGGDTRWALVDRHELWRDAGEGWQLPARNDDLRLNCLIVIGSDVWVGASEARLLRLDHDTLLPSETFDAAPGRDEWFTPWGGPPDVRSLAADNGDLFANVHVGGILRSDSAGSSWEPTIEIGSDVHEVVALRGKHVVAATARGLARSLDRGATWEFEDEGLDATYARAIAVSRDALFMTASQGPRGGRAALYRRPLEGSGFTKCEGGLPEWFDDNINTACVAAWDSNVAFGTEDGRVFLSSDQGTSWEQVAADLGPARWVEFAPD
jgi:hypothetical protein